SWRPEAEALEDRQLAASALVLAQPRPMTGHVRRHALGEESDAGQALVNWVTRHWQGQSVTFSTSGAALVNGITVYQVLTYSRGSGPDGPSSPTCANHVWAPLQPVGAKTTDQYGKVDPPNWPGDTPSPTNYQWGDKALVTWIPGKSAVSDL